MQSFIFKDLFNFYVPFPSGILKWCPTFVLKIGKRYCIDVCPIKNKTLNNIRMAIAHSFMKGSLIKSILGINISTILDEDFNNTKMTVFGSKMKRSP